MQKSNSRRNQHFDGNWGSLTGTVPNVSVFNNDAGYLTSFTEVDGSVINEIQNLSQVLSQNNDAGATNITNLADPRKRTGCCNKSLC